MADLPAALRQADVNIAKCATKAAQLQTVKPIVAYWCEYWVVNQILAKQLHTVDAEILQYTTDLMDKLEQTKNEYATEDAITDDVAGQAYVEQFAQETLDRAERAVKANKVTQQTATTFDAAATFFHLVNIWGTPDQETQQKIKYAKWNAARIFKAIKEGKDPNESNPKPQEPELPTADPDDLEARQILGTQQRQPTVEEVPDVELRPTDAAGVSLPHSPASGGPSPPSDDELKLPGVPTQLSDPVQSGYFPSESMPSPISPPSHNPVNYQAPPDLPSAPAGWGRMEPSPESTPPPPVWSHGPSQPPSAPGWAPGPASHYQAPAVSPGPPTFATSPPVTAAVASPPVSPPTHPYYTNMAPTAHTVQPVRPTPPTPVAPVSTYNPVPKAGGYAVDDEAMAMARKHCKFAISSLDFDDVPQAIKELHRALQALGAT